MLNALLFFLRPDAHRLENEEPTLSWKLYVNILQPKLKVIIFVFFCQILLYFTAHLLPGFPHSKPTPHPKKRQASFATPSLLVPAPQPATERGRKRPISTLGGRPGNTATPRGHSRAQRRRRDADLHV